MQASEYLKPKNWKAFIEGNSAYAQWKLALESFPLFKLEQVVLRAWQCSDCLVNKRCKGPKCSCSTPNMFFAPAKEDSKDRWLPWQYDVIKWNNLKITNEDWKELNKYLKEHNVDITSPYIFDIVAKREREREGTEILPDTGGISKQ